MGIHPVSPCTPASPPFLGFLRWSPAHQQISGLGLLCICCSRRGYPLWDAAALALLAHPSKQKENPATLTQLRRCL